MSIGEKIVEARRSKNLTQEQLAELLGVTRQSISRWEQNQAYPEMEKILRLSNILGVSCDYLLKENMTKKDCDTVGKEKPFMQTRLLKGFVSKKVKINLLDGEIDVDYFNKVCEILGVEEDSMKISYVKNKATEVNLIDISKIASLELVEDLENE